MDVYDKKYLIKKLAERDVLFDLYKKRSDEVEAAFWEFHDSQPPEVQKILFDYADSGRMMYLRLFHLACTLLELPRKNRRRIRRLQKRKTMGLIL